MTGLLHLYHTQLVELPRTKRVSEIFETLHCPPSLTPEFDRAVLAVGPVSVLLIVREFACRDSLNSCRIVAG